MGIDKTIENMEEILKKKKAERKKQATATIKRLTERIEKKKVGASKLQGEIGNLETEIERLKIQITENE